MIPENRKYQFVGELTIQKSRVLPEQRKPKDDDANYLFLDIGDRQFTFIYKIENPLTVNYGKPFKADLSFIMESAINIIQLNHTYKVLRGLELIGEVKIISRIR